MSVNTVTVSGNLARDPEMRSTSSGLSVMTFTVAVGYRRRNRDTDKWEDAADFIPCTIYGKRAEGLEPYLSKGRKVAVQGRVKQQSWTTDDGQHRSRVFIAVDEIDLMSRRDAEARRPAEPDGDPVAAVRERYPDATVYTDEDIPF